MAATLEQLIICLREHNLREEVLIRLRNLIRQRGEICVDLGWQLWNSFLTATILEAEVRAVYESFLTSTLTRRESARVCNALSVLQCMASHPDARLGLIRANMPSCLFLFLLTPHNWMRSVKCVRLRSLDLIAALAKFDGPYGTEILLRLLQPELLFPLCLHCINHGDRLTRKGATLILMKILMQEIGLNYCYASPYRFLSVLQVLCRLVETFLIERPCLQQLNYVLQCFVSLSRLSWLGGVYDQVRSNLPLQIIANTFHFIISGDLEIQYMLQQILVNLNWRPLAVNRNWRLP